MLDCWNKRLVAYGVSRLLAEFSPTAGIVTSADLTTVKLLNDAPSDKIQLIFEFVVYAFIVWFLVQEIFKVSPT
jgi:hypothetical protein